MYLPYFQRKVVFCSQKVEKLVNSMSFVVGSKGVADGVTALNIINMFLITGGSLLGVGIFETAINKTQADGKL